MGTINQLKQRLVIKYGCFDRAGDDVVLVSGTGRSGTSWLANICNYLNDFRYVFEPLNPAYLSQAEIKWCLSAKDQCSLMSSILKGDISNSWVNSRNKKLVAKRRLIKEIRTNFMLGWVIEKAPNAKILLLVRNPLAVAASRKQLDQRNDGSDWQWLPSLEELLKQPLLKSTLKDDEFKALSNQVGNGVVMETIADWCINNLVALRLVDIDKVKLVYYEELVKQGTEKIKEVLEFINVSISGDIEKAMLQRSETSRTALTSNDVLNQWQNILSDDEIEQATILLEKFNVKQLYDASWLPVSHIKGLERLNA